MNRSLEAEVALACYAVVANEFATFCNSENRGTNFKWENFTQWQSDKMRNRIWMYVPEQIIPKTKTEVENKAAKFAKEIATRLVEASGFVHKELVTA